MKNLINNIKLIRDKNFRNLLFSDSISTLGDQVYRVTLVWFALKMGGASLLSIFLTTQTLTVLITVLFGGSLTKFYSPRSILIFSDILRGLSCILLAMYLMLGNMTGLIFILLAAIFGFSDALFKPAHTLMFKLQVNPDKYTESNAFITLSRQIFNVIGPMIGGLFVSISSFHFALLANGITFILSCLFVKNLEDKRISNTNPKDEAMLLALLKDIKNGFKYIRKHSWLMLGILITMISVPIQQGLSGVAVPTFILELNNNPNNYASILSFYAIGSFAASILCLSMKNIKLSIQNSFTYLGIAFFIYSFTNFFSNMVILIGITFTVAFFITMFNINWNTYVVKNVDEQYVSQISSITWFIFSCLTPMGLSIFGILLTYMDAGIVITLSSWLVVTIIILLLIYNYRSSSVSKKIQEKVR